MLTNAEKKWLKQRKNLCARCFSSYAGEYCGRCLWGDDSEWHAFDPKSCLDENVNLLDVAEFEARVAVKAAELAAGSMQQESTWSVLRECRIAVEEKMGAKKRGR